MTSDEFKAIRFKLGLSGLEWGRALGYAGEPDTIRNQIRRFEGPHGRKIPPIVERLARPHLEAQDTLAAWFEECVEQDAHGWESRAALFESWSNWTATASEHTAEQRHKVAPLDCLSWA
jgi:hypothetical protein